MHHTLAFNALMRGNSLFQFSDPKLNPAGKKKKSLIHEKHPFGLREHVIAS